MAQNFGFTGVLGKQAHSRLRNWFSSAAVESKGKSDSGIIEFSFLSQDTSVTQQLTNNSQGLRMSYTHLCPEGNVIVVRNLPIQPGI
ncbi:hypothetical protein AU255_08945 [Methyloprofundus sedimenti]|uniref:Uncharacterized protein n=1 Tax=Methyloprofundus sedimenti TaxID=1420851 RepID=A0A1V8M8U2_9GAMM|nr:hypothetical protein AU255_08945 [Methyloprofundus sedimenti]